MTNKPMLSVEREPVAWAVEISGCLKFFEQKKSAENARRRYEKVMDAERMEPFPLFAEQAAPVLSCSFCGVTNQAGNPWSGHNEWVDGELIYRVMGCKDHKHLVDALDGSKSTPVEDHTQCEECKGWGYHENHHEGGGTECGECSGSGKAPVEQFSGDTVVCRRYQLDQHPGQNFYHYDLEPVYGSVPVTVSELITMVESAPVAVVLPDRLKTEPFTTIDRGSKNYKAGYNAAIAEAAKLNGLKP